MIRNTGIAGAAALVTFAAALGAHAQTGDPIMPPLSVPTSKAYHSNPTAWKEFLSQLPQRPLGPPTPTLSRATPAGSGTWTAVATAPVSGLCSPLLLTDGSVIFANCDTPDWYRLTPDSGGSYVTGTWSQIASLPVIGGVQYAPQYHASAVLPDGRVIIMGGEYNGGNTEVWTNLGAIYDPLANQWSAVTAPVGSGWSQIGDAQSVVLTNGTFMLGACCADPAADAVLNAANLNWVATGAPNAGFNYQDEQGYTLLPNGNVLTIDIWTNYASGGNATNAEQYDPATGIWSSAGNTPVSLPDPYACGNFEIGPAVLRPDGTVVAFGGNTGCVAGATADPTAIYASASGTWSLGPDVPSVCGLGRTASCDLADAPAALLPNGNILFAASSGYGKVPTRFFEFTRSDAINQVADPIYNANRSGAYYYNFLVLPSGQILLTDFSDTAEVYTPTGGPNAAWAPVISSSPATIAPGGWYALSGTQFNGLSQGAAYGDDAQMATNYPIVRITNAATGHVFFARTSGLSTMSVAPGTEVTVNFAVPATIETGSSELVVVANGIPSHPAAVDVADATSTALSASPGSGPVGKTIKFTATVAATDGSAVPSGNVLFRDGTALIGAGSLNESGVAMFATASLAAGTHSITAVYVGNSDDTKSVSNLVRVQID